MSSFLADIIQSNSNSEKGQLMNFSSFIEQTTQIKQKDEILLLLSYKNEDSISLKERIDFEDYQVSFNNKGKLHKDFSENQCELNLSEKTNSVETNDSANFDNEIINNCHLDYCISFCNKAFSPNAVQL